MTGDIRSACIKQSSSCDLDLRDLSCAYVVVLTYSRALHCWYNADISYGTEYSGHTEILMPHWCMAYLHGCHAECVAHVGYPPDASSVLGIVFYVLPESCQLVFVCSRDYGRNDGAVFFVVHLIIILYNFWESDV